jgi:hypothetical protein
VELEQELERPPDPRPHDQVKCLFLILFLFVLFEEASKLQTPELLGFGACLLQLNPATHQASERESLLLQRSKLRSLSGSGACLLQRTKLQSMRACCVATASSRA